MSSDLIFKKACEYYKNNEYKKTNKCLNKLLKTKEFKFDKTCYDMLSSCKFYLGKLYESYFYASLASSLDKKNKQLKTNLNIIKEAILKNI